jgi:hypothetical protein
MMSFARVRPHAIRDLRGNAGGAELVRDRIALRTGRDDQLAPAKVTHMAWACHGGGHIDHGSCHRLLTQHLAQALVVVHAVLQAQYLGVRCQVGFDLCGRCFGVGGFHAEQHHIGACHGTGFGAGGDGNVQIFCRRLQSQPVLADGLHMRCSTDQRDRVAGACQQSTKVAAHRARTHDGNGQAGEAAVWLTMFMRLSRKEAQLLSLSR